jgi:hypothetical protein
MVDNAEQEISARHKRLANIQVDMLTHVWIRELTDEITRLRHDLRERLPIPDLDMDAQ